MLFRNVSPGQEDPSLALHNAIFCTNEIIALSSSSSPVLRCCWCRCWCCTVHKRKFISCTIYFFPGSDNNNDDDNDVYCSTQLCLPLVPPLYLMFNWFCSQAKTMFTGKTYTIFEWEACSRNHVASIFSLFASVLHAVGVVVVVLLAFVRSFINVNALCVQERTERKRFLMTTFEKWFVRISIKSLWWETESAQMI